MIAAVTDTEVISLYMQKETINSETFRMFVSEIAEKLKVKYEK